MPQTNFETTSRASRGWAAERENKAPASERTALMFGGSAASRTTLNKSLFKGNAACITLAVIPSPPQPHALLPGTLAGGGSVPAAVPGRAEPTGQGHPRAASPGTGTFSAEGSGNRQRRFPAELLPSPSRCLLRRAMLLHCHPSHVKCHGGWIRHRAARWKYHRDSGGRSGRSDKSPAPVNVKGLKFTVTFTCAVSVTGRFAAVFVRWPEPLRCLWQGARAVPGLGAPGRALGAAWEGSSVRLLVFSRV